MKPWAVYLKRINGNYCDRPGCGGELGTYAEYEQARREAVGMTAAEARIKELEKRVEKLEKEAKRKK